ncbi:MAG: glycosyl hydrolase [Agathobacter sp.]
MRRLGTRILAITMAAAMMTSLTPQASAFLQQEIVYAAEEQEDKPFYSHADAVTWDNLNLAQEDWFADEKAFIEGISDTKNTENFDMTADVTIDQAGYTSLSAKADNHLKLQGVIKVGKDWTWKDSQDIPYLTSANFQQDGDKYKTSITIKFRDVDMVDDLKGIYFKVIGQGFQGSISVSNLNLSNVEVSKTTEQLAYTSDKQGSTEFDFSSIPVDAKDEDWKTTIKQIDLDTAVTGVSIAESAIFRGKITIDQAAYDSLTAEGSYIKLQTVMKIGTESEWNQGEIYPYLNKASFTQNDDNTYSAVFEDKFSGIKGGTELKEVIVRAVGKVAKGTMTISDVKISNVISSDAPLPAKDATVIDDFESSEIGAAADWANEEGWKYDNTVTPAVAEINNSKALKLNLDYSKNSGETWSEAKIHKTFKDGLDVSAYNQISYDLIYPAAFDGAFKAKVFAKEESSDTKIIEKDVSSFDITDLGNGMKKAVVTVKFTPNTAKITDLTLGTVGVSTDFKGDVYIDNITLSQYDPTADFVDITAKADTENASQADITGMATSVSLADKDATASARALYSYLKNLDTKDQVLFGHQNDTHKSVNTNGSGSDTKDMTGSISGVVGIDSLALTGTELGLSDTTVAVKKAVEIGKDAAKEGGILTLSAHMPNMSNEKVKEVKDEDGNTVGYDFSACDFAESKYLTNMKNNGAKEVLPGGKYNAQFTAYLDVIADYAKGLGDDIPVLFRPFHEGDGGWFWWGNATTDDETFKALYRYTEDYLTSQGVHNLIYVYSPCGPANEATFLNRYPGDDYVDVLSFDYYDDYGVSDSYSDSYFTNMEKGCKVIYDLAQKKGKVAAIAEAGARIAKKDGSDQEGIRVKDNPIKDQNWYKKINDVAAKTGMSYFLLWANFSDTNFYIPYKYNDTKGQELINEFIEFYNEDSSVFADGTNFYGKADKIEVENTNSAENAKVNGYINNVASKDSVKAGDTLKATVKNLPENAAVQFVLENGDKSEKLVASDANHDGVYEAVVLAENIEKLGKTDAGKITLKAGDETLVTLNYISFGKDKTVLPSNKVEDFDLYFGDPNYVASNYSANSGAGCSSSMTLDETNAQSGDYAGAFTYNLKGKNGYTGQCKSENYDFSAYNALRFWAKPDGKGQKLIIQLTSGEGSEEFEVDLSKFTQGTDSGVVTIPFSAFKGKKGGTFDASNITKFAIYCNRAGGDEDLSSTIYFDDIEAVRASKTELAKAEADGFAVAYDNVSGGGSVSTPGTSVSGDMKPAEGTSTTEINAAGNEVKVTSTTEKDADGNVISTTVIKKIENADKNTSVTVTTTTFSKGGSTVTATIIKTGSKSARGVKGTISSSVMSQITEAAGTKDVVVTQKVVDKAGKTIYTTIVNASDLTPGSKLKIFKYNEKTGEYTICNNKDYKVTGQGGVVLTVKGTGSYKLVNMTDAAKIVEDILATVKPANASKTLSKGKTANFVMSKKLNMANVAKITYSSSDSSVAKIDKNGKITAKKAGTAIVKAKVTLKNGKTKTISMKVKVK